MKVTKHYESGRVWAYIEEDDVRDVIGFKNEDQMRRLGECLIDLARIGGREVEIKEDKR